MSIKFNVRKAGIIALTTTVGGALGRLLNEKYIGLRLRNVKFREYHPHKDDLQVAKSNARTRTVSIDPYSEYFGNPSRLNEIAYGSGRVSACT